MPCYQLTSLPSARRNEDDGCQFVEEAVTEARTFHPFVRGTTQRRSVPPAASYTTRRQAEAMSTEGETR